MPLPEPPFPFLTPNHRSRMHSTLTSARSRSPCSPSSGSSTSTPASATSRCVVAWGSGPRAWGLWSGGWRPILLALGALRYKSPTHPPIRELFCRCPRSLPRPLTQRSRLPEEASRQSSTPPAGTGSSTRRPPRLVMRCSAVSGRGKKWGSGACRQAAGGSFPVAARPLTPPERYFSPLSLPTCRGQQPRAQQGGPGGLQGEDIRLPESAPGQLSGERAV